MAPVPGAFAAAGDAAHAAAGPVVDGWLDSLGDERIAAVAREAVRSNWDLRGAEERLVQARLLAARSGSLLWPQVDGVSSAGWVEGAGRGSPVLDLRVGLAATWELDVWGRIRASQRAAEAEAAVSAADLLGLRRAVAAQAAQSWVLLVVAGQRVEVDADLLATRERTRRVTGARLSAGVAQPIDAGVAEADVADAKALLLSSQQALDDARRSLEVLLGRYPASGVDAGLTLPERPAPVPVGLPSELLERRPDLIAADQRVAAAFYRVQEAKATRLPRIALTGDVGTASDELRDVLNPSNGVWSLGGNLIAPLLDGERRRLDVLIAESRQREALAAYVSTALAAFTEVERALSFEARLDGQLTQLELRVEELRRSRDAAELRYRRGLLSIFDLTQVEARLFAARRDAVSVRGARLVQRIALHLALGGDFEGETAGSTAKASVAP